MNKVINITPNGIKQAIDDLVNENEMLQDKVYKLEDIIKEAIEYISFKIVKTSVIRKTDERKLYLRLNEKEIRELQNILKGEDKGV